MPREFKIRLASSDDAREIAQIHVAATRIAYADIYSPDYLAALSIEDRAERWIEPGKGHLSVGSPCRVFVAFDNDRMVGFADAGPTNKTCVAELHAIYIDPAYIGKGAGKALLRACADHAISDGFTAMIAVVLSKNSLARAFYERNGARALPQTEFSIETGGTKEKVISYRWDNLRRTD